MRSGAEWGAPVGGASAAAASEIESADTISTTNPQGTIGWPIASPRESRNPLPEHGPSARPCQVAVRLPGRGRSPGEVRLNGTVGKGGGNALPRGSRGDPGRSEAAERCRMGVAKVSATGRILTFEEKPGHPKGPRVSPLKFCPAADLALVQDFLSAGHDPDSPSHRRPKPLRNNVSHPVRRLRVLPGQQPLAPGSDYLDRRKLVLAPPRASPPRASLHCLNRICTDRPTATPSKERLGQVERVAAQDDLGPSEEVPRLQV